MRSVNVTLLPTTVVLLYYVCVVSGTKNALLLSPSSSSGWRRCFPAFRRRRRPRHNTRMDDESSPISMVRFSNHKRRWDFFYGITPQTATLPPQSERRIRNVRQALSTALEELETLRREIQELRGLLSKDPADAERRQRRKRRKQQLAPIAQQVEEWAETMLAGVMTTEEERRKEEESVELEEEEATELTEEQDDESHSVARDDDDDQEPRIAWTEVACTKMLRSRYNGDGRTRCSVTWMKDSRGEAEDGQDWPCIRMASTIDAPIDEVSLYLSQEVHASQYNTLLTKHRDLEIISPQSKICWAQTPQVLFVKPRDFITYCSYRWRKKDGSQLMVVNQALDDYNGDDDETRTATAFCFRGATWLAADGPERTRIAMVAHASPGRDTSLWACRTATNTLAAMEPFKLFYRMNQGIQAKRPQLQAALQERFLGEVVSTTTDGGDGGSSRLPMHKRPVGIAQMGYACFWPDGAVADDDDGNDQFVAGGREKGVDGDQGDRLE